jgi:hypothetical protein
MGGKTPSVTPSSNKSSIHRVGLEMTRIEPSSRKDQRKLKDTCLDRDDNRCVITGAFDRTWAERHDNEAPEGPGRVATECAHMLPFSLGNFDRSKAAEVANASIIWEALFRYFPDLERVISSETINCPENAMTMYEGLHREFGRFIMSLEETVYLSMVLSTALPWVLVTNMI